MGRGVYWPLKATCVNSHTTSAPGLQGCVLGNVQTATTKVQSLTIKSECTISPTHLDFKYCSKTQTPDLINVYWCRTTNDPASNSCTIFWSPRSVVGVVYALCVCVCVCVGGWVKGWVASIHWTPFSFWEKSLPVFSVLSVQPGVGSVLTVRWSVHNCGILCLLSQTLVSTDALSEPEASGCCVIIPITDAAPLDECKQCMKLVLMSPHLLGPNWSIP